MIGADTSSPRPTRAEVDLLVERLLREYGSITVVGASANPGKAAHTVPASMQRHGWRIVPVNPTAMQILGEPVHRTLAEVAPPVGLVDVFRPSRDAPDVVRQAVDAGASAVWLQLGIASAEAREIASAAGLDYVEDRCVVIERARLDLRGPHAG